VEADIRKGNHILTGFGAEAARPLRNTPAVSLKQGIYQGAEEEQKE